MIDTSIVYLLTIELYLRLKEYLNIIKNNFFSSDSISRGLIINTILAFKLTIINILMLLEWIHTI